VKNILEFIGSCVCFIIGFKFCKWLDDYVEQEVIKRKK
jgi:hypothetical protein